MRLFSNDITLHNTMITQAQYWHSNFKIDQMTATRLNYEKDESKKEVNS